ncbi:MAG: TIGR01212 family radical SAM protein [Bacteroidales bacterium]|nr:TIGR01212 family radical SAM protein [Bacteroidales bacterium]
MEINPFAPLRYNSYSEYFKRIFGGRIQKVTIDAGFTCPNRDGTVARGGCTYCNNDSFNPSYCHPEKPIATQIDEGISFHTNRYRRAEGFLAYFQAYSNTYKPLEELKKIYGEALNHPDIKGIVIGTRSDCIDQEKLAYFAEIAKTHYVIIEYGIESVYDETLMRINRGHNFQNVVDALELTASYGLHTGGHLIFGLPGETTQMMMESVEIINKLPLKTIKFHQLQIVTGTVMGMDYRRNPQYYHLPSLEEYLDFITKYISKLNPVFVVERFAGEVPPNYLIASGWNGLRYDQVLNKIIKKMEVEDLWQGKEF